MRTLSRSLQDYPTAMLRAIAETRRVALTSNIAQQIVEQLATALLQPDNLQQALAQCSPQAQEALAVLLRSAGRSRVASFERRFGTVRRFGPGRLERENPQRKPANAAEELWHRGLMFRAFAQTSAGPVEFLYIPDDVAPLLPQPAPLAASFHLPAAPQPAQRQTGDDRLLHDFCTLLCLVQAGSVRLAEAGAGLTWRASSLGELSDLLLPPAPAPAGFPAPAASQTVALLLALAHDLGWLRPLHYHLRLEPKPVRNWLEAGRQAQRRLLLAAWRASTSWNDLCRTPTLHCEETGSWANDPVGTRERLLKLLAALAPGVWHRLDDLVALVKEREPDFQRPDGDYDTWYVRRRNELVYLRGFDCWDEVEGRLIAFILTGPLHWLGATDLGLAAPGQALSFRLAETGAGWLADDPTPAEAAPARITVSPDFTVLVPAEASLLDRFRVARFTTWQAGGPPFRYRITQSGLHRANAQGIDTARVLAYLRQQAGEELPANVAAALARWQA